MAQWRELQLHDSAIAPLKVGPLPGAILSCADKKVCKEAAEDLPYGPQTPQTAKRGSKPTFSANGPHHCFPFGNPLQITRP